MTIGAHTYRSTVAARGGVFLLSLSAENRRAAGVQAGDEVEVDVDLDTAPREVAVPPDLAQAIADDPLATVRFGALSYSHRLRWVLSVEDAKTPETRQRRIDKAVSTLHEEARKN